ncbi:deoxyribonuclease IV [Lentilactobacillus senioris]|uniref:deoxyribonuclease IV n=1 Tax=Lentilactobacillus senioris TaxID=931534 RepID=UPI002282A264|nr:deoxyribonuclease IV [Lentilactobacillus senioris]MCY9806785.1 deoxyribonuclease IV [Lentilactobacillus senioris]
MTTPFLIGSHVSMKGKPMFLGSAQQAAELGENVFMVYTGAPQNTVRKPIEALNAKEGQEFMKEHDQVEVVVHAPYIINLGNVNKPENFSFGIQFLKSEIQRAQAIGASQIVLHPGSHVGAGSQVAIEQIAKGLNQVLDADQTVQISLETMAGKGTEVGKTFDELAAIINLVDRSELLSVTFDTCHVNDAGYDIKNDFKGVLQQFDEVIGLERIKVIHLNDSKNPLGSHKDRHEIIGLGTIGFEALNQIAHSVEFEQLPKLLETPALKDPENKKVTYDPHGYEVAMLKREQMNANIFADMMAAKPF